MAGQPPGVRPAGAGAQGVAGVATVADLARLLRQLRHRQARQTGQARLTYRELAAKTGWSRGIIGEYFAGNVLPPTDRFDELTRLLGATPAEQGGLATARDRIEEHRRSTPPTNGRVTLPAALTRLRGRDGEVKVVAEVLASSECRLVTLTGSGGVGKTRLAREIATQLAPEFVDGVAWVSLAALRDPGLVVTTIADTLGLRELGARPLVEILHDYLRSRRMLLVLDNVEHLLPAAAQVAALLAAAPRLAVLATSRSPLHLQGEQIYPVAPLAPAAAAELFPQRPTHAGADPAGIAPDRRPPPVPRQLPAHTPHFVGRVAELRQLTTLLNTTTTGGGTVVITAIDGTAGIGKTALALHWAHQAAERFPDGQLYVNLRGFDPTNTPVHPAEVLRGFLDAFEISPEQIPTSVDAQAGLYRSLLTDRRVLVVLDNARDADQVRSLLPASPTCLVVITSRNQLVSLIAQHGAHPITLDMLTPQEARALLARHLGPDRVSAEPHAITTLINHCARLPLALAIVAARAATHPGFDLRVLAKELADEHTRLDALDTGDPTASVRAVFSWSYQHLSPPAARMFRLLGLHPGPDITLPAATPLTDTPLHQAREALGELTRAHLLTQHTPGRYTFHDLLRAYATHLTTTHHCDSDQRAALTRLFDHYLHTAAAATDTVYPADHQDRPHIGPPGTPPQLMTDPTTARTWLDTERANLTAIIAHTATHGWSHHTTQLANTLFRYLEIAVNRPEALTIYTYARHAAHHTGDKTTEALALTQLGLVHWQHGRCQQAIDHHQDAITLCREINFPTGEALALTHLGIVYWQQGHYQQAADHVQHALTICREIGDQTSEAQRLMH